jgi:hypothetical protein
MKCADSRKGYTCFIIRTVSNFSLAYFDEKNTLYGKTCQSSISAKEKSSPGMENVERPFGNGGFVGRIEGLLIRELKAKGREEQ